MGLNRNRLLCFKHTFPTIHCRSNFTLDFSTLVTIQKSECFTFNAQDVRALSIWGSNLNVDIIGEEKTFVLTHTSTIQSLPRHVQGHTCTSLILKCPMSLHFVLNGGTKSMWNSDNICHQTDGNCGISIINYTQHHQKVMVLSYNFQLSLNNLFLQWRQQYITIMIVYHYNFMLIID